MVVVCIELSECNSGDFNSELAHVLRRCVANKLYFQMGVLTKILERLGGATASRNAEAATTGRAVS